MMMYFNLGDWSGDGHTHNSKFLMKTNVAVESIREAYVEAVNRTGISFDHRHKGIQVCTDYEDGWILVDVLKKFKDLGMPVDDLLESSDGISSVDMTAFSERRFVDLWFQFVRTTLPDLTWTFVDRKDDIPSINSYGPDSLPVQFGYGLFY